MKILRMYKVKYLSPTNTKGARIKIINENTKTSETIAFDYAYNSSLEQASKYLENKGMTIEGVGYGKKCDYIVTKN